MDRNKLDWKIRLWEMVSHDPHFIRIAIEKRDPGALVRRACRKEKYDQRWSNPDRDDP